LSIENKTENKFYLPQLLFELPNSIFWFRELIFVFPNFENELIPLPDKEKIKIADFLIEKSGGW